MRRTLGQRSGAVERTRRAVSMLSPVLCLPPSQSLPSATRDVSWVSRQQRDGVCQRRTLGSERSWEGQQGNGREPQRQLQVPGDPPGAGQLVLRTALSSSCHGGVTEEPPSMLASPPSPRRSTHVWFCRSPERECSTVQVPCPPEGTFPAPLAR